MSEKGYMSKANGVEFGSGQQGKTLSLTFDQLNDDEQAVLTCLIRSGVKMKISQIVQDNGWDKPDKVKGNSMVRNAMRRLIRSSKVLHNKRIGDGTYIASEADLASLGPRPISVDNTRGIRRGDCTFYNACLDQAISGKWPGFACTGCKAYAEPDMFQKEINHMGLRAVQAAADMVEKYGKVHRVRGVKPGAEAKRTETLRIVETVSLGEVLSNID